MAKFDQDKEKSGKIFGSHGFKMFSNESKEAKTSMKLTCIIPKLQEQ